MKKIIFIFVSISVLFFVSCDHVDNAFTPAVNTDLDTTIYPGNWNDYVANEWPDFALLPDEDPDRNALIEDFTGHNCNACPAAGEIAHAIHEANPTRVFVASVHASNTTSGTSTFQAVNVPFGVTIDLTNPQGLELGSYFGTVLTSSGFVALPLGMINRTFDGVEYFSAYGSWQTKVDAVLPDPLKVAIKAKVNYFENPQHGYYLHTEIEKIDQTISNDLAIVVYMMEDSLIGPQNVDGTVITNYVHRDIFRGSIDGQTWGRTLTPSMMTNGKYYVNYSGIVPDQLVPFGTSVTTHNADNMHLLIYVYDKVTLEIYQVIKKEFIP